MHLSRQRADPSPNSTQPFIGMDDIGPGEMRPSRVGKFGEMRSAGVQFRVGDVLYGRLRPYLNKVYLAEFDGIASAEFFVFSPSIRLDGAFLKYLLHGQEFVNFATQRVSGDRPRVGHKDIHEFEFNLPSRVEQEKIVSKIDELFSDIDAGEASLKRVKILIRRYRQSILKSAVTGELTRDWREANRSQFEADEIVTGNELLLRILKARREVWEKAELDKMMAKGKRPVNEHWRQRYREPIAPDTVGLPNLPEGWVWASLDQLSWNSTYGSSEKSECENPGVAVLRIPNVREGSFDFGNMKFAKDDLGLSQGDLLASGDLLVIRTNGSKDILGLGSVLGEELGKCAYFASYLIRFRLVLPDVIGRWINHYWQCALVRRFIDTRAATSAGQYNISQSKLAQIPVAIPNAEEIRLIISKIDGGASLAEAVGGSLDQIKKSAAALRQSVLKAAFSGRLVPGGNRRCESSLPK